MAETHHIYLIPGFFGFINFGRLVYYGHVRDALERQLDGRGVRAEIHRVRVSPTASLRRRAAQVLEGIAETSARGPIHLIGHSTGGLDARLLCTPGVDLGDGATAAEVEAIARRVKTVISVSAPHYGTPLASFFTGLLGQKILGLLSLATVAVLRQGRLPLSMVARLASALARVGMPGSQTEALLDSLEAELIGRMEPDDRGPIQQFIGDIGTDQALLPQLTPDGIDLFNAAAANRPGVRYGCVVSRSRAPHLTGQLSAGPHLTRQASYVLFRWLHSRAGDTVAARLPRPTPGQAEALARYLGRLPRPRSNDSVVPTYSQLWGDVVYAAQADHLDVIGHFDGERLTPPHHDWITSGSGFDLRGFEAMWAAVATYLCPERKRWWQFGGGAAESLPN